jgi:carboxypeptidase Q
MIHATSLVLVAVLSALVPAQEQEPVDLDAITRLRAEGLEQSEVMETLWYLTDRYGPRLTNSPMQREAAEWAVQRLQEFGLENVHLEAWGEFGLGWSTQRCVVEMTVPSYMSMIAVPKAWTRGLEGPVSGVPVLVDVDSVDELEAFRGQLSGRIVLAGSPADVESPWEALATRHDGESLAELAQAPDPGASSAWASRRAEWRLKREIRTAMNELFEEEGVAVVLVPDGGRRNDYGVITLGSGGSYDPEKPRALPQVVISTEQFNRAARLVERSEPVELTVDVSNTFHDEDLQGYNVVGEIPGTDPELGDELVLIGGHFDSWHPGTGATDNGSSCAVMIEAARILKLIEPHPRRTVRVVLWTGEEQGLLGSKGYVKNHFADRDTMELLPEHDQLAAYFNLDNGAGKIRGIYMEGNAAVAPIFEAWLMPFADLGATTVTMRDTGGTDHQSFDAVGLPGFQFIQDPMDYSTRSHHTNMDLYERVVPGDVMQASVIVASFALHAAMRDEMLPRKPLPSPREQEDESVDAPTAAGNEGSGEGSAVTGEDDATSKHVEGASGSRR